MSVNLGIWDKLTKLVVFLLILAGAVGVFVWYLPVIQQNERMRQDILKLKAAVDAEQANTERLRQSIDAVTRDPATVARMARERLSYARPGETVFRFEPTTNSAPHSAR